MSTTIIRPIDREQWLAQRATGIGSSEVATILGLNPWETPYQLWLRKTGRAGAVPENMAMKLGHLMEGTVAALWSETTARPIDPASAGDWIIRDDERPWLQVSPDRLFTAADGETGILECKTTQMTVNGDDIPKHWFCQVTYQLGVSGMRHGSIAWLTQGRDFGYRDIELVPEFYDYIADAVTAFWNDNVLGDREPDLVNTDDVLAKYPRHAPGKVIEATEEAARDVELIKELRGKIDQLTAEKTAAEDRVKVLMSDSESLTVDGRTAVTWKAAKDGTKFDTKAFQAAHPDLYKEFCKTTPGARRFLIK